MRLSVPFIPDKKYADFLNHQSGNIESVYFAFPSGPLLDARMRVRHQADFNKIIDHLTGFKKQKKYALLNTRFIHPRQYSDAQFLHRTLDSLETLVSKTDLTGIVFCDAYFLNALADSGRKIISHLEAVPGINCMLDSPEKILSFVTFIEQTGFKLPGKIIPDRSLNRDIKGLEKTVQAVKKIHPDIKFELLANEGCIHMCPFKSAHDAQISFANLDAQNNETFLSNHTFSINRAIGCHDYFFKHPQQFLKSPFIRPEDIDAYAGMVDTIKICGRTLGTQFLTRCVDAYSKKSYDGNLLELMDAANWFAELYYLDNKKLDPGFLNAVTHCTKDCKKCRICDDLFEKAATKKSIGLKAYKEYL